MATHRSTTVGRLPETQAPSAETSSTPAAVCCFDPGGTTAGLAALGACDTESLGSVAICALGVGFRAGATRASSCCTGTTYRAGLWVPDRTTRGYIGGGKGRREGPHDAVGERTSGVVEARSGDRCGVRRECPTRWRQGLWAADLMFGCIAYLLHGRRSVCFSHHVVVFGVTPWFAEGRGGSNGAQGERWQLKYSWEMGLVCS